MSALVSVVLWADVLLAGLLGLVLFFAPDRVGDFVFQRETDGVHWHLIRCVGGQILSSILFIRFTSSRAETRTSCFMARVLSWVLAILITYHAKSVFPDLLHPDALIYIGFASIAYYLITLVATGWPLGDTLYKNTWFGNFLYQFDSLASISIGIAWIACPHWLLHRQVTMDESHELCGRFMGILFVSSYILSTHALHWKDLHDRSLAAEARSLCCFFILTAQIWSQYAYERDWSGSHWVGISLFSIWTTVAFSYRLYLFCTLPKKGAKPKKA